MRRLAVVTAAAGLVLAGCFGGNDEPKSKTAAGGATAAKAAANQPASFDPQTIFDQRGPGVVTVISLTEAPGAGLQAAGLGSGFVVDTSGYVATNAHVVTDGSGQKASGVYVQFGDGNRLSARIVGTDPDSDVGLLKIDPAGLLGDAKLVPLPFGSTKSVDVGEPVAAIGSPFGEEQSLSTGVVSGLHRDIQSLNTLFRIGNAIQTDAAINHGNSGGPLLDSKGRVLGINSQIRSTSGGGEGVGFAVPVETVKRSIGQLRTKGRAEYAYLGVSAIPLYPQLARRLGLPVLDGGLVARVAPGSPAAKAGLKAGTKRITFQGQPGIPVGGDAITAVDGTPLTPTDDLASIIALHRPGERVVLEVIRNKQKRNVNVTLGKRPENN